MGYALDSNIIKHNVKASTLGTLKYLQSFCIYDGKYYSTDGSNIGVQNSSFTDISTTALSLGHGNSFHIGSSNKGYVSGWNDNKVYVINMDTVTIDSVINLPTNTGYEDAAIDDINGIAYIFQRIGSDLAVDTYNIIAYDYVNAQTLYTKKTNVKFGWMQDCDFYAGKIIILYGGNDLSGVKRGIYIFNTSGDVISEFGLDSLFAGDEPEGVCFDRANNKLLVSGYNKKVYELKYI